ncbi:MAG: MFS transporter [Chloroflexi bacterium]|nr:MFS transporter [Chloroflexota bacterium]
MEVPLPRHGLEVAVRPMRTLWLLSAAHAVNHAQAALLPLVYLVVIDELRVGVGEIAYLAAFGSFLAGAVQLSYAAATRYVSRRNLLAIGGLVFGGGMALQATATSFVSFAAANIASRIGGSPQHPVGNALLAEQFPERRRAFAISAHIAGGNLGTIAIPLVGAWLIAGIGWRWTVVLFGVPAILIALAMLVLVRESGADRAAARAEGSLRSAFASVLRDRDLRWVYLSSVLGAGGRGLGVLNLFVPLYLARVLGLDGGTVALMYTVLLIGSVPGPLIAGWLSDRVGHKRMIVTVYLAGAGALVSFVLAGSDPPLLWLGIVLLSAFTFVESPQLQALLADIARPGLRDVSFATYFTLAFGVGSLWTAVYGAVIAVSGEATGIPLVFWLMAAAFLAAALAILPVRRTTDGTLGPSAREGAG